MSSDDRQAFIQFIKLALSQVPSFLRGSMNPASILQYMRMIPAQFRRYTVEQLLSALEDGIQSKEISW